eukprot:EG_transcript_51475
MCVCNILATTNTGVTWLGVTHPRRGGLLWEVANVGGGAAAPLQVATWRHQKWSVLAVMAGRNPTIPPLVATEPAKKCIGQVSTCLLGQRQHQKVFNTRT